MLRPTVFIKTDLLTKKVHKHLAGQCRNTHHKGVVYTHTLKTSTSLFPTEPQYMQTIGLDGIGFGWNIDRCNIKKGKYVWETDGGSSLCWWLSPRPHESDDDFSPTSTIEAIRANNAKAVAAKKTLTWWNEILAGLPEGELDFMYSPIDTREHRLRVWNAWLHVKKILSIEKDIPIFIIHPDCQDGIPAVFRVYSAAEREEDIKAAKAQANIAFTIRPQFNPASFLGGYEKISFVLAMLEQLDEPELADYILEKYALEAIKSKSKQPPSSLFTTFGRKNPLLLEAQTIAKSEPKCSINLGGL
jgi:hypothetical protein